VGFGWYTVDVVDVAVFAEHAMWKTPACSSDQWGDWHASLPIWDERRNIVVEGHVAGRLWCSYEWYDRVSRHDVETAVRRLIEALDALALSEELRQQTGSFSEIQPQDVTSQPLLCHAPPSPVAALSSAAELAQAA